MTTLGLAAVLWAIGAITIPTALAQPRSSSGTELLTLERALAEARRHGPSFEVARRRVRSAVSTARAAPSIGTNPELEIEGTTSALAESPAEVSFGATLSQEIEIAGTQAGRRGVLGAELDLERARARALRADLTLEVGEAFYALDRALRTRAVLAALAANYRALHDAAVRTAATGQTASIEADLLAVEVARVATEWREARASARGARARLNALLGRSVDAPIRLASGDVSDPSLPSLIEARRRALARRGEIGDARAARRLGWARASLARREAVPSLRVGLRAGREQARFGADDVRYQGGAPTSIASLTDTDVVAGAFVSIPLPLFQRRQDDVVRAIGESDVAEAERVVAESRVQAEVVAAFAAVEESWRSYRELARAAAPIERAESLYVRAHEAGQLSLPELLAARERLLRARVALVDARAGYQRALLVARHAMGDL